MNAPLEDQLHRLADDLSAPPSDGARRAVGHRARILRRRRRARRAVGGGVLAVALVVGGVALSGGTGGGDEGSTLATAPDRAPLPEVRLDLEGWEVADSGTVDDAPIGDHGPTYGDARDELDPGASFQVFRRPGELLGPTVAVEHASASDVRADADGAVPVTVGGDMPGDLQRVGADRFVVRWPLGDSHVEVRAFGLTEDEVLAFAAGLRPRDADGVYSFGSEQGDELGFDATTRPQGIQEDPVAPPGPRADYRWTAWERPGVRVEIDVTNGGDRTFEELVTTRLARDQDVDHVAIPAAGQTGLLFREHPQPGPAWHLVWRQDEDVVVVVSAWALDRDELDEVVAGLRVR